MAELLLWSDIRAGVWGQANYTWSEAQLIAEIQNRRKSRRNQEKA